ncbi:MAG: zinc-dependent peptidase [Pseudomonadales bacterium]|nr:zinc-dependent peptidase [Pseudomonadales bacterium]MBP9033381.1 zinc-dependent peptidase [Pseudomonadales bacterium]
MLEYFRRRKLARHAFDDRDWDAVCARLPLLARLDDADRRRLRETATLFLADKIVAPAADFSLQPQQRIEIAVAAALPVLRLGLRAYRSFHGVIVYPDEFLAPREEIDEAGVVTEGHERVAGESWDAGPILLSWADVEASRAADGYQVVIHECAHKLDLGDGDMNGVPDLSGSGISGAEWMRVMSGAWERTGADWDAYGETEVDDYALESPAEFFAVLSEHFFTIPAHLDEVLPEAYALLARFYRQDPLHWRHA